MSSTEEDAPDNQHDSADYVPKSVLLTGGAGFIGSNVMLKLVAKYPHYKMVCLDKLDYCATVHNFQEIKDHPNFTFVKGDICSADLINYLFAQHKIDTVLHFAAQTHVDNSFGNSFAFTQTNVFGTHVLLESVKIHRDQIKRFIHVSTDEVYGESTTELDDVAMTETSALSPTNPYAATKAAAEFLVQAYRRSFHLPLIITRGNNVYGPRQFPEKLIPKFIRLLEQKQPVPLHGSGKNKRSFLYVDDVADAFDLILHKGVLGEIYNIGTDDETENVEIAKTLVCAMGLGSEIDKYIYHVVDRDFNDTRYHISLDKLTKLGWSPKVSLQDGLAKTVQWYHDHRDHHGDVSAALVAHPRRGAPEHSS